MTPNVPDDHAAISTIPEGLMVSPAPVVMIVISWSDVNPPGPNINTDTLGASQSNGTDE